MKTRGASADVVRAESDDFLMKKGIRVGVAGAVLLVVAGCGGKKGQTGGGRGTGGDVVLQVETVRVVARPFKDTLKATGTLQADEAVMLRPEIAGIIEEINFSEGDRVKKGTVLVRLRDNDLRARLERAQAQAKLAETENERQQRLVKSQAISRSEFDQAGSGLTVAQADVNLAAAELARTEVRAPFDGAVGLRSVSMGEYVSPTTDIASFRALDPLKLEVNVPERYGIYLREGLAVEFALAGLEGRFRSEIYAIEPGIDPLTRTVRLRARVPNAEGRLTPGAFVEAEIELEQIEEAILVPSLAVVPGLREEKVFVLENGVAVGRRVEIGVRTGNSVLVRDGLKPGDEVILSSILQLRDGTKVAAIPPQQKTTAPE